MNSVEVNWIMYFAMKTKEQQNWESDSELHDHFLEF